MLAESSRVVTFRDDDIDPAQLLDDETPPQEEAPIIVYEGFLTQLVTGQLNLSVPYFTSIRKTLINMGCIRQLRRGGGTAPSQWEMIMEPTPEAFLVQRPKREPKKDRYSALEDQIRALGTRITELEDTIDELVQAWAKHYGAKEITE